MQLSDASHALISPLDQFLGKIIAMKKMWEWDRKVFGTLISCFAQELEKCFPSFKKK